MELYEINPYIRFCALLPKPWAPPVPIRAYDCRLFFVFSGKGSFRLNSKTVPIEEDTLVYIPSGMPYQLRYDNRTLFRMLVLNFDWTQESRTVTESMEPSFCRDFREKKWIRTPPPFDTPVVLSAPTLKELLQNILSETSARHPDYMEYSSVLLHTVLLEIRRMTLPGGPDNRLVRQITEHLCEHFAEDLSLSSLSAQLNYHEKYLNRVFRRETGVSIHRFLLNYRITRAKKFLQKTQLSITEIANLCGFPNQPHFSATFLKIVGTSPSEYRKQTGIQQEHLS